MMPLMTLVRLKLRTMVRRPVLLVFCLISPVLMSMLAGSTLERNDLSVVRGAYVDLAENEASGDLIRLLASSRLRWKALTEEEASRAVATGTVDGVVVIPPLYGEMTAPESDRENPFAAVFLPGKNAIASDLVSESFKICALTLSREAILIDDLMALPGGASVSREAMRAGLRESSEVVRERGARLKLDIHGLPSETRTEIVPIPDFAVEILFLSIFSLLSSLMLSDAATQQRMRSIRGGFARDYLSSLLAMTIAGAIQLALMAGLTRLLIPGISRPPVYWPVMAVFFLLMLAFGQLVSLIHSEQRFVPGSLILFISALLGGTFIKLPSAAVEKVGQYTPHGWAFASMSGMETTLPTAAAAAIAAGLLVLAYFLQNRSRYLAG
ncbi:MAG TPA: hypothetical protein PKH23_00705 [Bacillota bacterium]|nr:hypothetical protein [Bacillota bacterium]